ncbi:MAG: toll/interleukin-1 receptor domain-containing protein [Chloroflexota bacterium]
MKQKREQVFVSYSHADSDHLQRLKIHLRPFERESLVDVWSDTKIKAGQQWRKEIESALNRATVAILLISADFLASDFVAENELPPLLEAAQSYGVKILPVILKPCAFTSIPSIAQFQAINDPAKPLISLDESQREQIWVTLAQTIKETIKDFDDKELPFNDGESTHPDRDFPPDSFFDDFIYGDEMLGEEVSNPYVIDNYHVYAYEHIDMLEFMPLAARVLQGSKNAPKIFETVKRRFRKAGWEGDGEIRLLWIPPFIGAGVQDTYGVTVWFVKQNNNGTSFLASPVPLPFSRLLEQQL